MKYAVTFIALLVSTTIYSQDLRSTLLQQLRNTHSQKDWFVPANIAVEGLTAEQAAWKDGSGNHSAGQLTHHLVYWNERVLLEMKGQTPPPYNGNNDETFTTFDQKTWNDLVKRLDAVMSGIEKIVQDADEAALKKIAPTIANVSAHNAYHTGQIIFVRKLQGSWDAKKGVN